MPWSRSGEIASLLLLLLLLQALLRDGSEQLEESQEELALLCS